MSSSLESFTRAVRKASSEPIPSTFPLRSGSDFSTLPADPRDARSILLQHEKLDDQGDGIRSFVGMAVALLTLKRSLFLIDEPEAFLHPPQAFRMGEIVADHASDARQIVVATHSADVVQGVLSKTRDVTIIRIDRSGNTNSFNILDPARLKQIVDDPLLRSARVLDGLFYSGAIVVEADADSRFYHGVASKRMPNASLHFVNADNKQTVPRVTRMYENMGVRCAGIVDFDVLNDCVEFEKQLDAIGLDSTEKTDCLAIQREISDFVKQSHPANRFDNTKKQIDHIVAITSEFEKKQFTSIADSDSATEALLAEVSSRSRDLIESTKVWTEVKRNGRSALPADLQSKFDDLWKLCSARGLFINASGELESMLIDYGIPHTTNKRAWIVRALQLLPTLTVDDSKNPWTFMKAIHEQLIS